MGQGAFRRDVTFGFDVPLEVPGVAKGLLNPRLTWTDGHAYDAQARKLADLFAANFARYLPFIDAAVKAVAIG